MVWVYVVNKGFCSRLFFLDFGMLIIWGYGFVVIDELLRLRFFNLRMSYLKIFEVFCLFLVRR